MSTAASTLRDRLLLILREKPKPLNVLRAEIGLRSTTILHALSNLSNFNYVSKIGKNYALTNKGFLEASLLFLAKNAMEVFERDENFWLNHDLTGIPEKLMVRLGELRGCQLIKSAPADLDKVHREFIKKLSESNEVNGISPIFHPDYINVVATLIQRKIPVTLIVTDEVLRNIKSLTDIKALTYALQSGTIRLLLKENLKLALTVTDKFFSLGLFTLEGSYDYSADFMGTDASAIKWGKELFNIYLGDAKNVSF